MKEVYPIYEVFKREGGKKWYVKQAIFKSIQAAFIFGESLGCKFIIKQKFTT